MDQKRTGKGERQYWHDRSMLARHEETRTKRIENKQSVAFGVRTLLAVALHQHVQKPVETYSSSCAQSAQQLKLHQFRMAGLGKKLRDAIAACVFEEQKTRK